MRRTGLRVGIVIAAGSALLPLVAVPGHTATMSVRRWERPCDYTCEQQEVAMSPGLMHLVRVDVHVPITAGLFNLTNCFVGGTQPGVGCVDRGFSIGPDTGEISGTIGCTAVNTYANGVEREGTCALRSAIDPTRPGRAPVTVTTGLGSLSHSYACAFSLTPAEGNNDDGSAPDIVFVDAANYQWRVVSILWDAQQDQPRPEQGGTRWVQTQMTMIAELGGRTLTLQMTGRIESSSPCGLGFETRNFDYEIGGAGAVA